MASIFLIRHGQASFLSENYDQLSSKGLDQSQKLHDYFQKTGLNPSILISGTLQRQQQTMALCFPNQETRFKIDERWNEHFGPSIFEKNLKTYLQGAFKGNNSDKVNDTIQKRDLIKVFFQMHHDWVTGSLKEDAFEDWHGFKMRVGAAFTELKKLPIENCCVFTSGGVIASILGEVLGLSDSKMVDLNWQITNTSITELQLTKSRVMLKNFNCTPHLEHFDITYV